MKARLRPAANNQNQTVDCSHLVVVTSEKFGQDSGPGTWRAGAASARIAHESLRGFRRMVNG